MRALFLIAVINFVNVIDGKIIGIVAEPIKQELDLSDTQVGLLTGFAFSICYAIFALPLARLSDRGHRGRILAVALLFWSVMTAMCGLAGSYAKLALARMGVAIGESACSPASYALVADYFGPRARARAMSTLTVATSLGTMAAFTVGGPIAQAFGWRAVFLLLAVPGILIAIVAWRWLAEPRLAGAAARAPDPVPPQNAWEALRALLGTPGYLLLVIGASALTFVTASLLVWGASFFQRVYGWSMADTGIVLGVTFGVSGIVAPLVTAWLGDRRISGDAGAYVRVLAAMTTAAIPFMAIGLLVPDATGSLILIGAAFALISGWPPSILATIRALIGSRNMALATALLGLALNLLGIGLGPLVIGSISDLVFERFGSDAVRFALLACCVALTVAAACLWLAARGITRRARGAPMPAAAARHAARI